MSYKSAIILAKKNLDTLFTYDAGGGFTGELYFCSRRQRIITALVNQNGLRF